MMNNSLRYLAGTTDLPLATPGCNLRTRAGYDADTGLFIALPRGDEPCVPASPTDDEVRRAAEVLVRPWSAYRFDGEDSAAGLVSGILAAVCRPALDICPAYLFDAACPGSGKTKAATALGAVIEGRRPAVTPFSGTTTDDELRKRFTSSACDGIRFQAIDNISGFFKSSALAAVLTTGRISDRILGQSRSVDAAVRSLVTMTANNASMEGDLQRRSVAVRIDAGPSPTHRAFAFDPVSEALSRRRAIAEAACVIWRAYFNDGAPDIVAGDAGGFAQWSKLCRQPVLWLAAKGLSDALPWALGDPAASMLADPTAGDPELETTADLLRALHAVSDGAPFTSAEVVTWFKAGEHADDGDALGLLHGALTELLGRDVTGRRIGWALRNRRDRVVQGLKLLMRGDSAKARDWKVVLVQASEPPVCPVLFKP